MQVTHKDIDNQLREYPRLKERMERYSAECKKLENAKNDVMTLYPQVAFDADKTGRTNKMSDPVARSVIKALDVYDKRMIALAGKIVACASQLERIERLFGLLDPIEFDVIDYYYFRGLRPEYIAVKLYISRRTFYRIRKVAVEKMEKGQG